MTPPKVIRKFRRASVTVFVLRDVRFIERHSDKAPESWVTFSALSTLDFFTDIRATPLILIEVCRTKR